MISSVGAWFLSLLVGSIPDTLLRTPVRCLFAASVAFAFVYVFGPWCIRWLATKRVGQPIREDEGFLLGELHKKKKNTPTMGGAIIIAAIVVASVVCADWSSIFVPLVIGSLIVFGCLGAVDDWRKLKSRSPKGLSGRIRLIVQTLWAFGVMVLIANPDLISGLGYPVPGLLQKGHSIDWSTWRSDMIFPFMTHPLFMASGALWLIVWIIEWITIVGAANAVNLTDGLDGLASGCAGFVAIAIGVASVMCGNEELANTFGMVYVQSAGETAVCLSALAGACLGFLWFNSFPAQVFMGDTGSLAIGGMLGTSAVLLQREWLLALVGAIFVVETLSVMVQVISFKRTGQRVFLCAPLHHHFEYAGLHEAKVVVRFWIIGLILTIVGLLSLQVGYV